ncbi:MAG TPA: penicillin-binding transpeptidase domain-containing protein, partial [Prosthecobacter sp.]
DRTLYAKTGWVGPQKPQVGWWVGWVEQQGLNYPFALNIEIRTDADAKERVPVALECLKTLGIW